MDRYTIKIDITDRMARAAIDSSAHAAVSHFKAELGEHEGSASRIARVAAVNAVDMFKTWCNAELRMIEADHERRAEVYMMNPARFSRFLADVQTESPIDTTEREA